LVTTADLTHYRDLTDQSNDLIPLFLGLLKVLDEFAASVEQAAASARKEQSIGADDALSYAALGVLSLRRTLWRWAGHAASEQTPLPQFVDRSSHPIGPLLR
jgi:hypothetical protein